MTALLASVNNLQEAGAALAVGVDIIDLKEPAAGALGAVAHDVMRAVVKRVDGRVPVSATIGDLSMRPDPVSRAVERNAAAGVDYIKVGLFAGGDLPATLSALRRLAGRGIRLIAVLFADQGVDLRVLQSLHTDGFVGAMLDTATKHGGGLRRIADERLLGAFVRNCRELGLLSGLAGSLDTEDIAPLLELSPDVLGFRGAVCHRGRRTEALDPNALAAMRALIPAGAGPMQSPQPSPACARIVP